MTDTPGNLFKTTENFNGNLIPLGNPYFFKILGKFSRPPYFRRVYACDDKYPHPYTLPACGRQVKNSRFHLFCYQIPVVLLSDQFLAIFLKFLTKDTVIHKSFYLFCNTLRIFNFTKKPSLSILQEVGYTSNRSGNDWQPSSHRFDK